MVVNQPMGRLSLVKEVLRKMVLMLMMVREIQRLQLMEERQMVKTREMGMEQM